jgi:hypothetical protein
MGRFQFVSWSEWFERRLDRDQETPHRANDLAVMGWIMAHSQNIGGGCGWVTDEDVASVAQETGLAPSDWMQSIRRLEADKLIRIDRAGTDGHDIVALLNAR